MVGGMTWRIQALKTADHNAPLPVLLYFEGLGQFRPVNCYFWLLQGGGHNVLVDTGMGGSHSFPQDSYRQAAASFPVAPGMDTVSCLLRHGLTPDDIDTVILSHLHMDHCANAPLFRRARIVINARGWKNALAPRHPLLAPYPPEVIRTLATEMAGQIVAVADEAEVWPGLSVFWTGGHTVCSQATKVRTGAGTAIITGDVVYLYENLERDHPIGLGVSVTECLQAMARIRREADIVLPGHDPQILERHPGGLIG